MAWTLLACTVSGMLLLIAVLRQGSQPYASWRTRFCMGLAALVIACATAYAWRSLRIMPTFDVWHDAGLPGLLRPLGRAAIRVRTLFAGRAIRPRTGGLAADLPTHEHPDLGAQASPVSFPEAAALARAVEADSDDDPGTVTCGAAGEAALAAADFADSPDAAPRSVSHAMPQTADMSVIVRPIYAGRGFLADAYVGPRSRRWENRAKLVLDRTVAALLLVGLSPLLLVIALAVIASGPGPVIFRQRRQGWLRRDFVLLKFRTMRHEPGGPTRRMQTRRNDPRCTPVGRFLRAFSLDELPQLWNVVRGEMSLVGPRPHVDGLHDIDKAGQVLLAEYAKRYRVRPGITGWAQVNGLRGATATAEQLRRRLEYDLYYIENWSLLFDLKILVLTPFAMAGENAF